MFISKTLAVTVFLFSMGAFAQVGNGPGNNSVPSLSCHTILSDAQSEEEILDTEYVDVSKSRSVELHNQDGIKTSFEEEGLRIYKDGKLIARAHHAGAIPDMDLAAYATDSKGRELEILVECAK